MSTKFLVDWVLPGNFPPESVSVFFWHKVCWTECDVRPARLLRPGSNPSLFDRRSNARYNQPTRPSLSHVLSNGEDGWSQPSLSPHHRPMMNDHLWSMVCCKAWLHCSLHNSTTLHSTFRSPAFFLIIGKTLQKLNFLVGNRKRSLWSHKLADIKTDLAEIWFLNFYPKICR